MNIKEFDCNFKCTNDLLQEQELHFRSASTFQGCENHIFIPNSNIIKEEAFQFVVNCKLNVLIIVESVLHNNFAIRLYNYMK